MVYLWKVSKLMKFILQFYVFLIFFPKKSKNEKITFRDLFFFIKLKATVVSAEDQWQTPEFNYITAV